MNKFKSKKMYQKEEVESVILFELKKFEKTENSNVFMLSMRKSVFLRRLRVVFSDLRLCRFLEEAPNVENLQYFVSLILEAQIEKQKYFDDFLQRVNGTLDVSYQKDTVILSNKGLNDLNFFFEISKLYRVLQKTYNYTTDYSVMRKCDTPEKLADLFYRQGKF